MKTTVAELAQQLGGVVLRGGGQTEIGGFNSIDEAGPDDIAFYANDRYLGALKKSRAGAVLVPVGFDAGSISVPVVIAVESPTGAFARLVEKHGAPKRDFVSGIHPTAVVDPSATVNPEGVAIGPHAVVEAEAEIGDGSEIGAGCFVGRRTRIGAHCLLHPNVTVREACILGDRVILHSGCVIGSDGFGYELSGGKYLKIDQVGIVQLDDDVEVGANTTIDRARFGRTWIGEGTKIDNLVIIAHNCVIGKHCAIVAQTGISGSVRFGDHVVTGGQAGTAGHLEIAGRTIISARSGVTKSITEPGEYMGFPAAPRSRARKIVALQQMLPEIHDRLRRLERATGTDHGADSPDEDAS